jgi:hypothetical protein
MSSYPDEAPHGALTWRTARERNQLLRHWRRYVLTRYGERALRVAWVLQDLFNVKTGCAFPSNEYLAAETGMPLRDVEKGLQDLDDEAIVRIIKRGRNTSRKIWPKRIFDPSTMDGPRPVHTVDTHNLRRLHTPKSQHAMARAAAELRQQRQAERAPPAEPPQPSPPRPEQGTSAGAPPPRRASTGPSAGCQAAEVTETPPAKEPVPKDKNLSRRRGKDKCSPAPPPSPASGQAAVVAEPGPAASQATNQDDSAKAKRRTRRRRKAKAIPAVCRPRPPAAAPTDPAAALRHERDRQLRLMAMANGKLH